MSTAPLRIGFAGANAERGWAFDAHLAAIRALPEIKVQAVLTRSQASADAAAAVFGAASAYTDLAEMVHDPEIDVIAVTVKVPEHRDIVLAALEAGKHVYCEWPLARNATEAELLTDAARKAGMHVAIGTQGPLAPAIRHAAKLVRDGAIGRPLNLRVVSASGGWGPVIMPGYAYLEDKENGATLAAIPGGHTLASIEAVVGAYTEVSALNSSMRENVRVAGTGEPVSSPCIDHMLVTGRHAGGCVSSLEVLGGTPDLPFRFELRGTAGRLEITGHHPGGYQCGNLSVTTIPASDPQPPSVTDLQGNSANVAELWAAFAADIRDGTRNVPDFAAALRLTRLLDAIDTASASGQRVSLKD